MIRAITGASGHRGECHAYAGLVRRVLFCALMAARKRKEVKAMMAQLMKKEALVMAMSQLRTSRLPAMFIPLVILWDL